MTHSFCVGCGRKIKPDAAGWATVGTHNHYHRHPTAPRKFVKHEPMDELSIMVMKTKAREIHERMELYG